ncbi:signal peptidase II [Paracoccus sp. 11-3]|uniref:Lipoprotein signal peptidase n=2 Tax=Paracoccus amoyensis TaxID=2760093 RepID=A0A926GLE3_9RHOB|nr:signal peptidase II [Paracoccus amoyensis]
MRLVIWITTAIILLDQVLKYYVVHVLRLDQLREIDVLPPWLNLRMAWNQGVNFGLMSSENTATKWILVVVAAVIVIWVWVWIWRSNASRLAQIAAGLLIGGAIGNVIDRIYYGAVADFLNMSLPNWSNPYSFNVADIAIFAGAIGLVLMPQKKPEPVKATRKAAPKSGRTTPKSAAGDNTRDGADNSR